MSFEQLSDRAQVHRLRRVAFAALERYPIEVGRLRLIQHDFNTTFRVETPDGGKFALRIDLNRRKPIAWLDSEMAWLAAIARDTDIDVPVPQVTHDGHLHTAVEFPEVGTSLNVALMSWLPGRNLDEPTIPSLVELGRLTARLHQHASSWEIPADVTFPPVDEVLMDSPDRLRTGHPLVTAEQREVFVAAFDQVEPSLAALIASGKPMPIHGDLHQWNVKWLRGRLSVFDFDDAGIGVPAQDLAITTYYLPAEEALRAALLDGYQTIAELPPFTHDQFHAALAARNLLIVNDLIDMTTRSARDMAERFLEQTTLRMRGYLETGVYRALVPGVPPVDRRPS